MIIETRGSNFSFFNTYDYIRLSTYAEGKFVYAYISNSGTFNFTATPEVDESGLITRISTLRTITSFGGSTDRIFADYYPSNMLLSEFKAAYDTSKALGNLSAIGTLLEREPITFRSFGSSVLVQGGANDDALYGGLGPDKLLGRAGVDQLFGGDESDILMGGSGADLLDGGSGLDYASYEDATGRVGVRLDFPSYNSGDAFGDTLVNIEGIIGSSFDDVIVGDANSNPLSGAGGNDVLYGQDGPDAIYGGDGNDELYGGLGVDFLVGDGGFDYARYDLAASGVGVRLNDYRGLGGGWAGEAAGDTIASMDGLVGSYYDDVLAGNDDYNVLHGLDGNDQLHGLLGDDRLLGGNGNDILWGGGGADYIDGGAGFDIVSFDTTITGSVTARLDISGANSGDATGDVYVDVEALIGSTFSDTLVGNDGANTLTGLAGDDKLHGLAGNDTLLGGGGNDQIFGGEGTDYIDGGAGFNYARYDFAGTGVAVDLSTGQGSAGESAGDFLINIQGLFGSQYADFLVGDANDNTIIGQGGDDIIFSGPGADTLSGGQGRDTFAFRASDFRPGLTTRVTDFTPSQGDALTLVGVDPGTIQIFDDPGGVLVTVTGGNGGIKFEGLSAAGLAGHLFVI